MALIVPPKVSSHLTVVEYMQEALSLTTQGKGSIVLLLPQLQIGIMSCAALRATSWCWMVGPGLPLPTRLLCQRWWCRVSLLVSGGLAPAVAYQHLLDF